jgi:hypothetical protein
MTSYRSVVTKATNAMTNPTQSDPVPAISEKDARGVTADIFADIRSTLNVEVVNLIWRHLATMPGALEWVWDSLKPLYLGPAIPPAAHIRNNLPLPYVPALSYDTLFAGGLDASALSSIGTILDSYQHTNALALVCFSAFLARFRRDAAAREIASSSIDTDRCYAPPGRVALPRLIPIKEMSPSLANLVHELNGFGEDSDPALIASMYRHLAHWPVYLALIRTFLLPLHEAGDLKILVSTTRRLGEELGAEVAGNISTTVPNLDITPIIGAVDRFVRHPIARMTGICSLIRRTTPN